MDKKPGLPGLNDIENLPRWASVAYAARCARRVLSRAEKRRLAERAITIAENASTEGIINTEPLLGIDNEIESALENSNSLQKIAKQASSEANKIVVEDDDIYNGLADFPQYLSDRINNTSSNATNAMSSLGAIKAARAAALSASENNVHYYVSETISASQYAVDPHDASFLSKDCEDVLQAMKYDYEILKFAANKNRWGMKTPVPQQFFSLHTAFDTNLLIKDKTIVEISNIVNEKMIDFLRRHPKLLYTISPREFEELIAELFDRFEFDVKLTAATRDGGRDIIAVKNDIASVKYLIECKRYAPDKKVDISVVQRLHGVVASEGATKGIVATTSNFTSPANNHLSKHKWLLEGRNFDGLVEWLDLYQKHSISKEIKVKP